jgi:hypothetical protein
MSPLSDFDTSSTGILSYVCSGKAFPKVDMQKTVPVKEPLKPISP